VRTAIRGTRSIGSSAGSETAETRRRRDRVLRQPGRKPPAREGAEPRRAADALRATGREVAVEVEPVTVGAGARRAAVRVLVGVEDHDQVVEDRVDIRVGAVRRRRQSVDQAHRGATPSYSFPWMALWKKVGIFSSPPSCASLFCALAEWVSASRQSFCQFLKSRCCWSVVSWLIVTRYIGLPAAECPKTSTDIRPSRRSASIAFSVQPIA
jgi:hypothetical protein